MKIRDLISMSVRSLWRRKLRTTLTVLGVVIGTVSIVLMLSLGIAMDQNMEEQFAQWGDLTLVEVNNYSWAGDEAPQLTDEVLRDIEKIPNVQRVIPKLQTEAYLTLGKQRSVYAMQVVLLNKEDMEAMGYELSEGHFVEEEEKKSIVIGHQVLAYMHKIGKVFDWDDIEWGEEMQTLPIELGVDKVTLNVGEYDRKGKPLVEGPNGKIKEPKGIDVKVVGILDSASGMGTSEVIFVPKSLYDEIKAGKADYEKKMGWNNNEEGKKKKNVQSYEQVTVKVDHRDHVLEVVEQIKALGYSEVYSSMEDIERVKEQSNSKRMALGGIGIVSFLVAAIGIANTMMMSIYERTREIGVMKVIGAKLKDIKHMFLIEALLIGAIGGIVGSLISFLLSKLMNMASGPIAQILGMYDASVVSVVPLWLMGAATLFATLVGLISGYFPAKKATKLSALSAIKTE